MVKQKQQPMEIERKFLVRDVPDNLADYESKTIRQGYCAIGVDGSEVRLRDSNGKYTMTIKSKGGLSRGEWEVAIDQSQFNVLDSSTVGKTVEKTRYLIPYNGSMIELDIYKGKLKGLVSAEVEFDNEQSANDFVPPEWFSVDITSDSAFKNQQLAINGLPD